MRKLSLLFCLVVGSFCFGQRKFQVPNYTLEKPPVQIDGAVWFPANREFIPEKHDKDSFLVHSKKWHQYMYWDTSFLKVNVVSKRSPFSYDVKVPLRHDYQRIAEPFYMKQHEVTNQEYRDFLKDVEINGVDFLRHAGLPANFDMNLKPDSLRWMEDFGLSYNEPLMRNYFSHPKYNDYPVVCVSYYQAKAYCHWLTEKLNEKYKLEGYALRVELPSQLEWDRITHLANEEIPVLENHHFIPNLLLSDGKGLMFNELYKSIMPAMSNMHLSTYMDDGYMYPAPANVALDKTGEVINLHANVSEWMTEDFETHWAHVAQARQAWLLYTGQKSDSILADMEAWFNATADANGQLVRGGNWVHESQLKYKAQRLADMSSFTFVSPEKSHCTLGFRYVIRLVYSEE